MLKPRPWILLGLVAASLGGGCTQLQRTSSRATRLMEPILGRRSAEPGLTDAANPTPWADAAGPVPDEPGTFQVEPATQDDPSREPPPGTVPALGVSRNRRPAPTDTLARAQPITTRNDSPEVEVKGTPPADPLADADAWLTRAEKTLGSTRTYRVRMTRQERVGESLLPQEVVLLNLRRSPLGVRLEWPEGPNQGREVLYSLEECGGQMQVRLKPSLPVPPIKMAPDSPLALQNSRHPINEAGIDPILADVRRQVDALRAGDNSPGKLTLEADEDGAPLLRRVDPTGTVWTVTFDPKLALPTLVRQVDPNGNLIESYQFQDYQLDPDDLASSEAFDPAKRWEVAGGFLGRLARAAQGTPPAPENDAPAP